MTENFSGMHFDNPPVVETVIGVQFSPLRGFMSGHLGLYWNSCLPEWPRATDAAPIVDQFEVFDAARTWRLPGLNFQVADAPPIPRIQISNKDDDRVVQVQSTRFMYNWRKRDAAYPRFDVTRPEFERAFADFKKFTSSANLGDVALNQWEVTYIDHIPRGDLWDKPADWTRVLPGLMKSVEGQGHCAFEGMNGSWRFAMPQQKGRVHVTAQHGKTGKDVEVLVLTMIARGPITNADDDPMPCIDAGHAAIVGLFEQITSPEAHGVWKRRTK